jgi:hypothetical protein
LPVHGGERRSAEQVGGCAALILLTLAHVLKGLGQEIGQGVGYEIHHDTLTERLSLPGEVMLAVHRVVLLDRF